MTSFLKTSSLLRHQKTSPKFEVRFCHNQLQKSLFGQITELQVTNIEGYVALGAESPPRLAIFENLLLK